MIGIRALNHLHELSVRHGLTELFRDAFEVPFGILALNFIPLRDKAIDEPECDVASLVVIEEVEDLLDVFAGILIRHFGRHHIEKFFEVDRS